MEKDTSLYAPNERLSKLKGIVNFVQWMLKIISSPLEHLVSYRVILVKVFFSCSHERSR